MAIITNAQVKRSVVDLRTGGRVVEPARPDRPIRALRPVRCRPGNELGAGRRPPRLVAAPRVARPVVCAPRRPVRGVGWLVLIGVLVFVVTLSIGWAGGGGRSGAAPVPQSAALVQVRPGETLWDIAQRLAPASSPDAVVARIRQLNSLSGDVVRPGELLAVPDGVASTSGGGATTH